jgi:hypothetical protein
MKIYVAGRYSDSDEIHVIRNVLAAVNAGIELMRRGHQVFVPHAMTCMMDRVARSAGSNISYDEWTRLDDTFLSDWADALFLISNSPGADHELEKAAALHKWIYLSLDEIPEEKEK